MRATPRLLPLLLVFCATRAWAHGFGLELNSGTAPTSLTAVSEQPYLDLLSETPPFLNLPEPTPGQSNLFTDAFGNTPDADGSWGTYEGFAQVVGATSPSTISSATFNILSPLYFSDGTGPAVPAAIGTYLHIYQSGQPASNPVPFNPESTLDISGTISNLYGFQVTPYYHELEKDLYINDPSQTYGEYGLAFDVDVTFNTPSGLVTLSSGRLVDVFATDIPGSGSPEMSDGGFATYADPYAQQDPATLAIYNAAVPEPSSGILCAIGAAAIGCCIGWRRSRGEIV